MPQGPLEVEKQCLDMGLGDCDEQSNAFMSIMRVKGIPTWYVFGALADPEFNEWEGHAWAYIMLPMSEEWCENNDVILNDCYVEGAVDVVNRKWLVHTPTAYIDWIEPHSTGGQVTDGYYYGGSKSGIDRLRHSIPKAMMCQVVHGITNGWVRN